MNIFERWEIDIVRLLLIIKEENRYIVVAMDYFSRWLEIRSLKVANADTVIIFLYKKIICRFGILRILQSDKEIHFVNEVIQKLTKRFRIRYSLLSPYYLQTGKEIQQNTL